ncbi:hypothetical protein O181_129226 [Austropuccinia psidii MF-1]|uniref:Uncharacterized protein n=1 Tax=Austropuccinia psidii MF-1 TaxID=1389203 RepID=A0A9Q3L0F8_9BASI|nr:hypothetical protein [Austropuccinia psidii MF-1]
MLPHPCLIFSLAYNPYSAAGPSSYASDAALIPLTPPYTRPTCLQRWLPSLCLQCPRNMTLTLLTILMLAVPSQHASDARGVPSRHASDAAYHPYTCSALSTCLRPGLPSLHFQ